MEFIGGTSTTVEFNEDYDLSYIEENVIPKITEVIGDNEVQTTMVKDSHEVVFKTKTLDENTRLSLDEMFEAEFGVLVKESESISATVSNEMRSDAITAIVIATLLMLIYIAFRFSDIRFGISSVAALVHDVLVVLAFYAFTHITVGSTFIACILTIVGYSINDTIVIFDRIRENLAPVKGEHTPEILKEVVNQSLMQTLSRSIHTSITTFIMVLMLYILGVASIREFSIPLMAGLVCGTYSSVCIATQLWYVLKVKFPTSEEEE